MVNGLSFIWSAHLNKVIDSNANYVWATVYENSPTVRYTFENARNVLARPCIHAVARFEWFPRSSNYPHHWSHDLTTPGSLSKIGPLLFLLFFHYRWKQSKKKFVINLKWLYLSLAYRHVYRKICAYLYYYDLFFFFFKLGLFIWTGSGFSALLCWQSVISWCRYDRIDTEVEMERKHKPAAHSYG